MLNLSDNAETTHLQGPLVSTAGRLIISQSPGKTGNQDTYPSQLSSS
jgi:hypothetical protein